MFFQLTKFLLLYSTSIFHLSAASVTKEICLVTIDNNPLLPKAFETSDQWRVAECDRKTEKCCDFGCCDIETNRRVDVKKIDSPKHETDVWKIVWITCLCLAAILAILFVLIHKVFPSEFIKFWDVCVGRGCGRTNRQRMRDETRTRSDLNGISNPNNEDISRVQNTHPITPPPSYEAALFAPSAPLQAHDRIPSYEDVIKGTNSSRGYVGPGDPRGPTERNTYL